jgi:hypothetical protein
MIREDEVGYVEIKYPLFVKGAAANVPPRKRKIRMEAVFFERAQPTWKPCKDTTYSQERD